MITSKNLPLASCLCVTRHKVTKLKRAINCFQAQTYSNKELIIVYEDNDLETKSFAQEFRRDTVIFVEVSASPKLSLGELRNISVQHSNGEYFCQWDDDDWYHANRLSIQMNAVLSNLQPVSTLTNWLLYDEVNQQAYFSFVRIWEGSILCKKDIMNQEISYTPIIKGEDAVFFERLLQNSKIFPIVSPNLYIYVYHGQNTWDYDHFQALFKYSQKLPVFMTSLIQDILSEKFQVAEASALLDSPLFLEQLDYFYSEKKTNEQLEQQNALH